MTREAHVRAPSNIALAKYWGKADVAKNLPAVPSLSMTLDGLSTYTRVRFDPGLNEDRFVLDGATATGRPLARVSELLDRVRRQGGFELRAEVVSDNDFPTAAGLASSASGFAALALAALTAAGESADPSAVSALARQSSASAARSVFGGYVALPGGADSAEPVAPPEHFPLSMLVAVTERGEKAVGSTAGMQHTAATSPYYAAWLAAAPAVYAEIRAAIAARDLQALGEASEHSALAMHASMWAARPAIDYFVPATLAVLKRVRTLRTAGTLAYCTMDAGPHVKVICRPEDAGTVISALESIDGVRRVIRAVVGGGAEVISADAWAARRSTPRAESD